jgi:hypothetical protein
MCHFPEEIIMAVVKDTIVAEITWFNTQIADLNATFIRRLKEDGHDVKNEVRVYCT